MTNARRYEMTDIEREKIKPFIPEKKKAGYPINDLRTIANGIIWIVSRGAPWGDLSERYAAWNTVYKSFASFEKQGIFE